MKNDIKDLVGGDSQTVQAIYAWNKAEGDSETRRGYLGASSIGHECERYLWYAFRFCCKPEFDGRMHRLFQTGHLEEPRMVRELRGIGCEVHDVNPSTGKQFAVTAMCGHFGGHMDGCILGIPEAPKTWHVTEYKTASAKNFAKVVKQGVKKAYPKHFAQMMIYMGLSKMTRAFYMVKNKDTDHLHSERVRFDSKIYLKIAQKIKRIIEATQPPERFYDRPDSFGCKYCDAQELCWGMGDTCLPIPSKTCRSCCHATPLQENKDLTEGEWFCEKHKVKIPFEGQVKGCPDHLVIPGLIVACRPDSAGSDGSISMEGKDGEKFIIGTQKGQWSTEELMSTSKKTVFSAEANQAKQICDAKVVREVVK